MGINTTTMVYESSDWSSNKFSMGVFREKNLNIGVNDDSVFKIWGR